MLHARSSVLRSVAASLARRSTTSASSSPSRIASLDSVQYTPGERIGGYVVKEVIPVPSLQLKAVTLKHERTQAEHLHIARVDSNNVFSVAFKTLPEDSTGVAHILEHTTLCGSQKYPCRDPFFKMLTRSLTTYMNAWTGNDFTMYPFSTTNATDYHNLLSVYLDAVYFPRLSPYDFKQEGWRLEHSTVADPTSDITYKGIVFNEMKGVFASPESLFSQRVQQALYPGTTYSHVSGGEPINVVDLTYEQLKEFHQRNYHPSRSLFFTYGDIPLANHLSAIEELALSRFPASTLASTRKEATMAVERWSAPRTLEFTCPVDQAHAEGTATVSKSFVLQKGSDVFESFVMRVLCGILTDGPDSPFYKSLIDSGLGTDFAPNTGLDNSVLDTCFSVGLSNIEEGKVDEVLAIVEQTFQRLATEGVDMKHVDAVMHQIELSQKHQTSNFGLDLAASMLPSWIHGALPADVLDLNGLVQRFREATADPSFLKGKIAHYFVNNKHTLTSVMRPDPKFTEKLQEEEASKLKKTVDALTEEDKKRIHLDGLYLESKQNAVEDVSILPSLKVSDIDRSLTRYETQTQNWKFFDSYIPVQTSIQPTSGVSYFRALARTSSLPAELQPYLPLFTSVLTSIGTHRMDSRGLSHEIRMKTGGLAAGAVLTQHHTDSDAFEQALSIYSHCLDRNIPEMYALWSELFTSPRLDDTQHLRNLIRMAAADGVNSIPHSGHSYAASLAASKLSEYGNLSETHSGLAHVAFMQDLAKNLDTNMDDIIDKLRAIAKHTLRIDSTRCALNADEFTMDKSLDALKAFLDKVGNTRYLQEMKALEDTRTLVQPGWHNDVAVSAPARSAAKVSKAQEAASVVEDNRPASVQPGWHNDVLIPQADKPKRPAAVAAPASEEQPASVHDPRPASVQPGWHNDVLVSSTKHHKTFVSTPFSVNFASRCIPAVPYTHPDQPKLQVLLSIMSSKFLHREIREKGGAYGGGAGLSSGTIRFYSYRDPCTTETLDAFDASVGWALDGSFTEQHVDEAKLSIFQKIDSPVPPGSRGLTYHNARITYEMQQQRRERLLSVTKDELVATAQRYLASPKVMSTVILGAQDEKSKFATSDWSVSDLNNSNGSSNQ